MIATPKRKLVGLIAAVLLGSLSAVGEPAAPASAQTPDTGFQGLTPARILDTRSDLGAPGPVGADRTVTVDVTGVGGVPDTGVGAVVLNLTATNASEATFVTVFPTGAARPTASNLNVVAGQTVPNLVIATVGTGGTVQLYNFAGTLDLVADVTGWFPAGGPPAVATTELPEARTGAAYQTALVATGGIPPYTFAVSGLPAGITAEPGGTLDGVTGWVGDFTVSVIVTDTAGDTSAAALTLTSRTSGTVVAGIAHTCALPGDGTVRCWGANSRGQLGDNSTTDSDVPRTVAGLSGVTAITAGDTHTCALVGDRTARCWGNNDDGQLGNGGGVDRDVPVAVTDLSGATAISAGGAHTCALLDDGTARCWGRNSSGQLGHGGVFGSDVPVTVTGLSDASTITAGGAHTCALVGVGTARCWGRNSSGQLGNGGGGDRNVPVTVTGLAGAKAISAGGAHTCAPLGDGTARCWGENSLGQLGNGTGDDSTVPVTVTGLSRSIAVTAADAHTCAPLGGGSVRCWGSNELGQLGDGTQADSTIPVTVVELTGANAVAGGEFHTCAHLGDGTARCWGGNDFGQLGDGSTTGSLTPVTVIGFP